MVRLRQMEVGMPQPTGFDLHRDLAVDRRIDGDVLDVEPAIGTVQHCGLHGKFSRWRAG